MAVFGWTLTYFIASQFICGFILAAQQPCDQGKFGWKCKLECGRCQGGDFLCDTVTGACPGGCEQGFYGPHCLLESKCNYNDNNGIHYRGSQDRTENRKSCVKWQKVDGSLDLYLDSDDLTTNYCRNPEKASGGRNQQIWCYTSKSGSPEYCKVDNKCVCPKYLWGPGCKAQCHCSETNAKDVCDANGVCPVNGQCAPGWKGVSCHQKCAPGTYGRRCSSTCSASCLDQACDAETGECSTGCRAGYMGDMCDVGCQESFSYGRNCRHECGRCRDGDACNPKNGHCNRGCDRGYNSSEPRFQLCDKSCSGRFGANCAHICGLCKDNSPCSPRTGDCPLGSDGVNCQVGWTGAKCLDKCPAGRYGLDCREECGMCKDGAACDAFTGQCMDGCMSTHMGFNCIQRMEAEDNSGAVALIAGLVVGMLIVLIALIILIIAYRRRNNKKMTQRLTLEMGDTIAGAENCQLLGDSRVGSEPVSWIKDMKEEEEELLRPDVQEPIYVNVNGRKQTAVVGVPDLYDYILKNKENGAEGFKNEFQELPMGLIAFCDIARKQENRVKNRYGNIFAYDHSRVILDTLPSEPNSDYVNANYMDGYSRPKSYIASQGPNKVMIRDFWRMVWQQRVSKIVMLTNLMEACKKKCEQYWPDEGSQKFGDITVLLVNSTKYSDFIIRTFELTKEAEHNRIVKQFHFTTWSDHGAPTYPTTLLAFRRKVINFKPDDTAPILSHCSAGIGRTGTFIALNYLLEQAKDKGEIDVLGCAQLMRSNRVNMIQTLEQYVFVYEAVLEAIKTGNTTIARSNFHSTYEEMLEAGEETDTTPMERQHNVLQLLSPTIEREECSAALMEDNMAKNRFKNILPANRSRPFLYTPVDDTNDYINAVYLSSYVQKDQFIVTQMPLPTTVADFWRMLYDTSSDTIIMLNEFDRNDKSCALYWPEEYGYSEEHGPLSVELLSSSEADVDVTLRVFKLSHMEKGEERAIKQFQFKSWPDYQTQPNTVTPLLRLYRLVTEWLKQNSKGPVTIHCMNGASKSGVFVAMSLLLERLDLDYEVDVYQTVKQIRVNRPQFIENLDQYKFLYQIVQEYMDQE